MRFQERLREVRFSAIKPLIKRADTIRNKYVAHFSKAIVQGDLTWQPLCLSEFKAIRDTFNDMFDALSFKTEHLMLPADYSPRVQYPAGYDHRTDIEQILDSLARNSVLLNMPEQNPEQWPYQRAALSEQQIEHLNYYRRRFGLSEV